MSVGHLHRRLSAIFYADVAGYSRLTAEDEEGTHRRLNASLDAIAAAIETHSGKVLHFAGDAVLAEFDSVVNALTCAVDIQRALKAQNDSVPDDRKLQFRIGINLGDVIVDRKEIYGDGVNVATRLEDLAEPGGICISRPVYDQVKHQLELGYEYLGERKVKNIAEPVRAYRVLLESDAAAAPKIEGPRPRRGVATLPQLLQTAPMFVGSTQPETDALEKVMSVDDYADGHLFISEGEGGDALYVIMEGEVLISRKKLAGVGFELHKKIGPGEMFGLISLVDSGPCTASCRAVGSVKAASLQRSAFNLLFNIDASIAYQFQYLIARQLAHDVQMFNQLLREIVLSGDETKIYELFRSDSVG
ncbi:MAG: cyclic nucleotide-binding domain-containing protein [Gammaproteobacteria bacterium]|nr:cyclic nucleotide-binding domain-containing protein [Gammaproteobacteria bacterium]